MRELLLVSLIGILFVVPQLHMIFAQKSGLDYLISTMRMTHNQLMGNVDQVKQLLESNNTSEALNLLDGMDIEITHMNDMFNDLVWEASNKGH
jgi:hypothetical protein